MDPIKILKRAWTILWSYRALWIFGILLALTTAGGGGGTGTSSSTRGFNPGGTNPPQGQPSGQIPPFFQGIIQSFERPPFNDVNFWIGFAAVVLFVIQILVVVSAFLRYISETALIRMVDQYEQSGEKATIRQGFRWGWSRTSWRLFLINLLLSLPNILAAFAIAASIGIVVLLFSTGSPLASVMSVVAFIGILFLLIFVLILYNALMNVLRHFAWRACALEGAGVFDAIRLGFGLIKRNWKNVGLMWLIMIGLGIAWGIAMIFAFILLIPVFIIMAVVGVVVAGVPAALVYGLTSLFISAPLNWIVAALVGLPILFLVIGLPIVFLRGLMEVFRSTVWTLTYRETKALESVALVAPPVVPETPETPLPQA